MLELEKKPVTILLVDDQHIIAEAVKRILEGENDIDFFWCQDPADALEQALLCKPTIILQDLVMPEVDGLMLVKYLRAHTETKNIPLVVLSVKEDPLIKAKAFAEGADDYMVKLPDRAEFLARVRYHTKAYTSFLEKNYAFEKLKESQKALKKEIDEAADYVKAILPLSYESEPIKAVWTFIPSTFLGGDIFGYQFIDKDRFALYLLDVCGHGVGAALLSISAANVLREKLPKGFDFLDPKSVLSRLNTLFPMEKHHNMFFSMWYGVYDISKGILTYSNAGHPPPVLKDLMAGSFTTLPAEGPMIGAISDCAYQNREVEIKGPCRLYLFSDGVFEHELKNGQTTTLNDFLPYLKNLPNASAEEDLKAIAKFSNTDKKSEGFADDFSLVIADFLK